MRNQILNYFPDMVSMKIAGFTSKDISSYLNNKYGLETTDTYIRNIFSTHKKGLIFPKFRKKIIYFYPDTDALEVSDFSKVFNGIFYTYKSFLTHENLIKKEWIITEQNIKDKIINPVGRVYLKWFLGLFHIKDNQIVDFNDLNDEQKKIISAIPQTIENDFELMNEEIKIKFINYLSYQVKE